MIFHIDRHASGAQGVVVVAVGIGGVPDCADFHLLFFLGDFAGRASLLLAVGLDYLRGGAGGEVSVFAFFEQCADYDFRTAPGLDTDEPAVVFEVGFAHGAELGFECVADSLGAAGFAGEIDTLEMRAGSGTAGIDHVGHGIGDDLPIFRIERDLDLIRTVGGGNDSGRQVLGIRNVRADQQAATGDGGNGARHLNGRSGNGALADANGNGFTGVPFLFVVADFPLFGRHDAGDFLRQVDAGALAQAEHRRVFGDAGDAEFFR